MLSWVLPLKEIPLYKTPSGAVKLQVLVTPPEYRQLRRRARLLGCSISALARSYLADMMQSYPDDASIAGTGFVPDGKYQRRGFAKRKRA